MKTLFFFLLVTQATSLLAQTATCGVDDQELIDRFYTTPENSSFSKTAYNADTKYVFNVRFHVVYNDDGITRTNTLGVPGIPIGFDEVMNAIRDLNVNFNQFNIFFKYYGFDQVNETDYLTIETNTEYNELIASAYSVPDAINIYIVNGGVIGGAIARAQAFDDNWFIRKWTLCHEIGHFFGLMHPDFSNAPNCENVEHAERDPSMPNFNADIKGDRIVDTHAAGNMSGLHYNGCDYLGGAVDCLGVPIQPYTFPNGYHLAGPPMYNMMMAEDIESSCTPFFTPGQGIRMRERITGTFASYYAAMMNSVESLYEPFEYPLVLGDILSVQDQPGQGGAIVCRQIMYNLRFQKGFDYFFTDSDENSVTVNVNTQYDHLILPNTYLDVTIHQVDPTVVRQVGFISNKVDRICAFEAYKSGMLYSTQVLGSMNMTIEELNEIEVNDPDLYKNLMEDYYYILKKMTESGAIQESQFYKSER